MQSACAWPVPTPKEWKPSAACTAAVQEAHVQQGAGKWDNPNTYNFCPIEARLVRNKLPFTLNLRLQPVYSVRSPSFAEYG